MKTLTKYMLTGLLGLACWSVFQCNAPHNNPLDPENPDNPLGQITGRVETLSLPPRPIAGAQIYWQTDQMLVKTNQAGKFAINNIQPRTGNLIISKEGYSPDTVQVSWPSDNRYETTVRMNAIPDLDSLAIYTTTIHNYNKPPDLSLSVALSIIDLDNDIDSVYVSNEQFGFKHYLDYDRNTRLYGETFNASDLNVESIRRIVGHTLDFYVVDSFNSSYLIGKGAAIRVIFDEILIREPISSGKVSGLPEFKWETFGPGFDFHFEIEIYEQVVPIELVQKISYISADSSSYKVKSLLNPEVHLWRIWCVDSFQNRSSSKYATFEVE